MKSNIFILSFFAMFLTISPVLAQNLPKSPNNNIKSAFDVILLGAGCQAVISVLRSVIKNSADVNSYIKLDARSLRQIQKKLTNSILVIEKELPLYREIVKSAEVMPEKILNANEKNTYARTFSMLTQIGNQAVQDEKFLKFLDNLFNESETCLNKFDEYKAKVKLLPRDKQE